MENTLDRNTCIFAIATAVWSGLALALSFGLIAIVPALLVVSVITQRWWPTSSRFLTVAFAGLLCVFTVPISFSTIRNGHSYPGLTPAVMHTLWVVTGPLVLVCATAILVDVLRWAGRANE